MRKRLLNSSDIFYLFIAMILGYASWIGPGLVIHGNEEVKWPLSPLVMTDRERATFFMVICLLVSGLLLGFFDYKRSAFWAAATVLPIVILSLLDAALSFSPHSLFGIEMILYAIFSIPAILGAFCGSFIRKIVTK